MVVFPREIQLSVRRHFYHAPAVRPPVLVWELIVGFGIIVSSFLALVEKGWIKMQTFSHGGHKPRDTDLLTPVTVTGKSGLTAKFLRLNVAEYEVSPKKPELLKFQRESLARRRS